MRRILEGVFAVLTILITQAIAAAVVAGALAGMSAGNWRWFQWLMAAPFIYMAWLLTFLVLSVWVCGSLARKHPKPRYVSFVPGQKLDKERMGLLTALVCYRRRVLVKSLPLVSVLEQSSWRSLVYRSWSPSVHIGEHSVVAGDLLDPDLTNIGKQVFLGGPSHVVAHNITLQPDGSAIFFSAPVTIGDRATTGGGVLISPGCVIGEDAVLEPGSVLLPFTRIPPGEVWGGNPAAFRRKRQDIEVSEKPARAAGTCGREVVQQALGAVPPVESWDSMSRMAITAAIFDRHGVTVPFEAAMKWRGLEDIDAAIGGDTAVEPEADQDVEMIPLLGQEVATRVLAGRKWDGASGRELRLLIAASFTAQPLASTVTVWGRAFGFNIECNFAPYAQVLQPLLNPASGVNVVLMRPEDLGGDAERHVEEVLGAVERFPGGLMVGTLPPLVSAFSKLDRATVERIRQRWLERLTRMPTVQVIDFANVVESVGIDAARASGSEVLTRAPYAPQVFQRLGIEVVRRVVTSRRSAAKVVAIDCDNTLWGGVLGEAGHDGIDLAPDGKGRSFQLLQEFLLRLKERGILLAVVSRNEEHDVRRVFEQHPEMILRPEDITAWKVNWRHKSENLLELATELRLGLDSFVFVDDDPAVRLEVKSRAPAVHVVPLPEEHALWCETLGRLWLFESTAVTEEDAARTQLMENEERRTRNMAAAATLEEFLESLGLEVEIREPGELDWARVAQLTHRTNQFNSSLKRLGVEEVQAAARQGIVLTLRAKDRFGDYGMVGVAILKRREASAELDSLLMSCRALGRAVEDAFLHAIGVTVSEWGARELIAPFVSGPRNGMIKDFLHKHGFAETEPGVWRLGLDPIPHLPSHVNLRMRVVRAAAAG